MTVNQAGNRPKYRLALTTTCLQSFAFRGNFLWFGGYFIEQIWAALEIPFRWRKWMYSILLWTDRRDSWFSIGSFFPELQTGSRTIRIPCRESLAQRKMGAFCPHSRTVTSYLCKSSCFPSLQLHCSLRIFVSSDEKSDCAIAPSELRGNALNFAIQQKKWNQSV